MRVALKGKIWDKEAIHSLLDSNPQAVANALMVVYANQTADEQAVQQTRHHNGVGFNGRDAHFLSDIAAKWKRYGRWASERQCNAVRRAMKKYHKQLLAEIASKPGAEVLTGARKSVSADVPLQIEDKREHALVDAWD